jgi:hypothetical protein
MYPATSEDDQANIQKHQLPNIHKTFLLNGDVLHSDTVGLAHALCNASKNSTCNPRMIQIAFKAVQMVSCPSNPQNFALVINQLSLQT